MIPVGHKDIVERTATATGKLLLSKETVVAVREGKIKTGDPFEAAKVAAFFAVKNTPLMLPHCHPLPIESCQVSFNLESKAVSVTCSVSARAKTGVEMEALTGASIALLTFWDMTKYLEKDEAGQYPETRITDIRVIEKRKGEKQ